MLPPSARLEQVAKAKLLLQTWNGDDKMHEPLRVNDWTSPIGGLNHFYALSEINVPAQVIRKGDNVVTFFSTTQHHALEVLWPGPAVALKRMIPLHIDGDANLRIDDGGLSDWRIVRMGRQKGDMPTSFRFRKDDSDLQEAAFNAAELTAGIGLRFPARFAPSRIIRSN